VAFDQIVSHKIPLVVTYHHDVIAKGIKAAFFAAHRRALMPAIMKRADRILVNSLDYAEHSDIRLLLDDKRIVEMPFGVDLDCFHPGFAPDIRLKHEIPNISPVIIFVGGLDSAHYFKGVPVLLDALEKISDAQWHALIVGDGDLKESYEAMSRVTPVSSRIHFVGKVLRRDLPDYYRAANIHVLPSVDKSEAFGIVNLEAAASGLPSVVSDLPGVRTTVLNGQTGFHVPARDSVALAKSLRDLLENSTVAERMGEQARRRAEEEYNWPTLMERLVSVYKDIVAV
jgi:glycosyltransferase involved in cell wall biosynthesis